MRNVSLAVIVCSLILVNISVAAEEAGLPKGAIGIWHFDEGKGKQTRDASGYGHNMELSEIYTRQSDEYKVAPEWVKGVKGKALSFNKLDDRWGPWVRTTGISKKLDSPELTICVWIRPDKEARGTDNRIVTTWACKEASRGGYTFKLWFGRLVFQFALEPKKFLQVITNEGEPLEGGYWYHVAITHNGKNVSIYVNGEKKIEKEVPSSLLPATAPLAIGNLGGFPCVPFRGIIDEVVIFNRALSQEEIVQVMSLTCGDE